MRITKQDRPALLLVDIQKGFEDIKYWGGQRNNPYAEENAAALLRHWRRYDLPVFHIRHCSTNPGSPLHEIHAGNAFQDIIIPEKNEPVIKKNVNSAFIGTDLKAQLDERSITKLVIAGLTTDHCISTTTRMAGNLGFDTVLVSDATAAFCRKGLEGQIYPAELIHSTALASLNHEFATVVNMEFVIQNI